MFKSFTILMMSGLLCLAGLAHAQDTTSETTMPAASQTADQSVDQTADEAADMTAAQADTDMQASDAAMGEPSKASDAAKYTCNYQGLVRHVEIAYEKPGFAVPCSVLYRKETEEPGVVKTLWTANNQAGYCEDKTSQFVDKLEGLGWACQDTEL